jgi:hypothetical protein
MEQGGDVVFVMMDGDKRVVCRVSQEALEDAAGARNSTGRDRMSIFEAHRTRIIDIACRRYDAGEEKPRVKRADLIAYR